MLDFNFAFDLYIVFIIFILSYITSRLQFSLPPLALISPMTPPLTSRSAPPLPLRKEQASRSQPPNQQSKMQYDKIKSPHMESRPEGKGAFLRHQSREPRLILLPRPVKR